MKQHLYSPLCCFAGGIFCLAPGKRRYRSAGADTDFPAGMHFSFPDAQTDNQKARRGFPHGLSFYPFFTAL